MKEFTEISLQHYFIENKEAITENNTLVLDAMAEKTSRKEYLGYPLSIEQDILKLSTQMYYKRIPLSEMNTGVAVKVFTSSRKKQILAEGVVKHKYYLPSSREDWKISQEIDPDHDDRLDLQMRITPAEKEALAWGKKPLSMDDKWFMYCDDTHFHYFRSWTGIEIFRGSIHKLEEEDAWLIRDIMASKTMNAKPEEKERSITSLLKGDIKSKLALFE